MQPLGLAFASPHLITDAEAEMLLTVLDQVWIWLGLQREELQRARSRGFAYAVLAALLATSAFFASDLLLNVSGRFG